MFIILGPIPKKKNGDLERIVLLGLMTDTQIGPYAIESLHTDIE